MSMLSKVRGHTYWIYSSEGKVQTSISPSIFYSLFLYKFGFGILLFGIILYLCPISGARICYWRFSSNLFDVHKALFGNNGKFILLKYFYFSGHLMKLLNLLKYKSCPSILKTTPSEFDFFCICFLNASTLFLNSAEHWRIISFGSSFNSSKFYKGLAY